MATSMLMQFLNEYNVRNRYIAQLIDDNAIESAKVAAKDNPSLIDRLNRTLDSWSFPYIVTIVYYPSVAYGSYEFHRPDTPDEQLGAADLSQPEMDTLVRAAQTVLDKPVSGLFTDPYNDTLLYLARWPHISDTVDLHPDIVAVREMYKQGLEPYEIWERITDYVRDYVRKLAEVLNGNPIHF